MNCWSGIIPEETKGVMDIEQVAEYELSAQDRQEVRNLLETVFSSYPEDEAYWHQLPNFRLLARKERALVGHLGVEYRRVRVGAEHFRIFGISDLCVHPEVSRSGVGTSLVKRLEALAPDYGVQFLLTFATHPDFYRKCGFEEVQTHCRWLMIHQGVSMGVMQRKLNGVMVKAMEAHSWPVGELDLLGHIF